KKSSPGRTSAYGGCSERRRRPRAASTCRARTTRRPKTANRSSHGSLTVPREIHSYSSLATLASCAEKFRLAYVEELEPPGVNLPQVAGTAFDEALNRLYVSGWDAAAAIAALEAAWGDTRPPLGAKHGHLTLDFLRERVRTYMRER